VFDVLVAVSHNELDKRHRQAKVYERLVEPHSEEETGSIEEVSARGRAMQDIL
jgi:hypothetical protein